MLVFAGFAALTAATQEYGDEVSALIEAAGNAVAGAVQGVVAAVSNKRHEIKLRGEERVILGHLGKMGGAGGQDPNNFEKWGGDIERHLRIMRDRLDRMKGKIRDKWQERVDQLEDALRRMRDQQAR